MRKRQKEKKKKKTDPPLSGKVRVRRREGKTDWLLFPGETDIPAKRSVNHGGIILGPI